LELWGRAEKGHQSCAVAAYAFDLPLLRGVNILPEAEHREQGDVDKARALAEPSDDRLRELQEWQEKGSTLSTTTAQALRELVFVAIEDFIDWDDVGLAKSVVSGRMDRVFKAGQIGFRSKRRRKAYMRSARDPCQLGRRNGAYEDDIGATRAFAGEVAR